MNRIPNSVRQYPPRPPTSAPVLALSSRPHDGSSVPYPPTRQGIPVDSAPNTQRYEPTIPLPYPLHTDEEHPTATTNSSLDLEEGLPMIPKADPPALPSGVRSLYISVLRKSDHVRVHHRLEVRDDMTDQRLFRLIRDGYNTHLLGSWRRWFTLKGLKSIQILEVTSELASP
jgi:hypothetical protein